MKTETISYRDGDVTLKGYLAQDETRSGKRPGILVMPEAFGLGPHAKTRAERIAKELGYVALAGDPYGDGVVVGTLPDAMPLFSNPAKFRARGRAALDTLAKQPNVDPNRLAAIGFCMGGTFGLELARDGAQLRGVVGFHSGLQTQAPAQAGKVKARILVCIGADDPMIPIDQVKGFEQEMTGAGADWQLIHYGGTVHSFTNPEADGAGIPGIKYNKSADERSWKSMVSFFEEIFA